MTFPGKLHENQRKFSECIVIFTLGFKQILQKDLSLGYQNNYFVSSFAVVNCIFRLLKSFFSAWNPIEPEIFFLNIEPTCFEPIWYPQNLSKKIIQIVKEAQLYLNCFLTQDIYERQIMDWLLYCELVFVFFVSLWAMAKQCLLGIFFFLQ